MKKGLMNNWGLKILSFLLAVMLWLIVVNIDDPVTTQTFNNIPVSGNECRGACGDQSDLSD